MLDAEGLHKVPLQTQDGKTVFKPIAQADVTDGPESDTQDLVQEGRQHDPEDDRRCSGVGGGGRSAASLRHGHEHR